MEGLDASYALLSDVSARNRKLQARLRSSLPLLWTDNALVMTSTKPRRRRGGGGLSAEQSQSEADQMLLALEGQSSLQVSRRYRRRMEWEVARRIARVDRELQQYPPAQRFWHQKRNEVTLPAPSASYRLPVNGVDSTVEGAEGKGTHQGCGARREGVAVGRKTVRERGMTGRVRSDFNGKAAVNQQWMTWARPEVETKTEVRAAMKHAATSSLHGGVDSRENTQPNAETRPKFETDDMKESPLQKSASLSNLLGSELQDDMAKGVTEDNLPEEPVNILKSATTNSTHVRHPGTMSDSPHSSPVNDIITKEKEPIATTHQDSEANDMSALEESNPRPSRAPAEERSSSSIGRQVLSEFRTMPSVASFGARPTLSAGGLCKPGDMRLNAEVLRRLFSDLDTDKDGHVNRVETCMALHRLQISVPTTKIISFFRHIHSSDGKVLRSRGAQHMPMNEVINYKEFVAFVTAAYDQQQQQKAYQNRAPAQRNLWKESPDRAKPLPAPSTSLPIYAHPTSSPRVKSFLARAPPPQSREKEVRVYEMDDVESEHGVAALEERVIKEIPDFLVSKMLADTFCPASIEAKGAALSVVRKSLELLVGEDAVDDKVVNEIAQELIRERLRNVGTLNQEEGTEDITGLRKAGAYYNEEMLCGDVETGSAAGDSSSEDLVYWVDVLTEEQVGCLVQQIWKDKQASLRLASLRNVENVSVEELSEIPKEQTMKWIDEATDTNGLYDTATLSEKAAQVSDEDNLTQRPDEVVASTTNMEPETEALPTVYSENSEPVWPSRTHLSRALRTSLRDFWNDHGPNELFGPATSIGILQHLRQQRRLHQSLLHEQQLQPSVDESANYTLGFRSLNGGGETNGVSNDLLDRESLLDVDEDHESVTSQNSGQDHLLNHEAGERDLMPLPTTKPVLLTQKMLNADETASNESSLDFEKNVSVSNYSFSSISDCHHVLGMYREIDHHQLHAISIRRRRPQRRQRRSSASGSSVPDSICSAELSEGELSHDEALDLSDGEIFGDCKRKYISRKNTISTVMKRTSDDDSLRSSVESGELPALMKARASFRRQVLAQSASSSIESGELEDGAIYS